MGLPCYLEIIVIEADEPKSCHNEQNDPDVMIFQIGPEQRRDDEAGQYHQPAHGGRALLGEQVGLRSIETDRLSLALFQAKGGNDPGAEKKYEKQRRENGPARPEGNVSEKI